MKHELVQLGGKIDWAWLDEEMAPLHSDKGRPGIESPFVNGSPLPPLTTRGRAPGMPLFLLAEFDFRLSNRAKLGVTAKERAEKGLKGIKGKRPGPKPLR